MALGTWDWLILIILLCGGIYYYLWKKNQYYKERKINYEQPQLLMGNMLKVYTGKEHMLDLFQNIHLKFPKDRYIGVFNLTSPVIVIKDPEIIKLVTVKNFENFVDHMQFTDEVADPLSGRSLFALKGELWKEMRTSLSPAFTSSKMRGMFPFMEDCAKDLVAYLTEQSEKPAAREIGFVELEIKDLFTRSANDIIASCAFGVKIDSHKERENTFYKMSKSFTQITSIDIMKFFIFMISPPIMKLLGLQFTNAEISSFFRNAVIGNMKTREEEKIVRQDMIHLLMLAKHGKLKDEDSSENNTNELGSREKKTEWSDDDLTAQAMLFVFAGFDTTATLLNFIFYELAINTDVQEKLYDEIATMSQQNGGKIEYNDLNKLVYLDMVVSETLRLWPGAPNTDRYCVKPIDLPPQNDVSGERLKLKKGDGIWIPTFTIHRDPKYFENPNKFDPERFSEERKSSIQPFTYFPFGLGPRACIGSRFALMEAKILIIYILLNFELTRTPKTTVPMKLKNHMFEMVAEGGCWIGMKRRELPFDKY